MLLGNHELEILCVKYKIKSDSTQANRTYRIWTAFGDNIKLKTYDFFAVIHTFSHTFSLRWNYSPYIANYVTEYMVCIIEQSII